jgi:DNA-binding NarL/FixJ family response regulator
MGAGTAKPRNHDLDDTLRPSILDRNHQLPRLTERERDVLVLMAEGRSNAEIGAALVITDSAVSKHINSIFAKLGLYPRDAGHRRVLAVLRNLGAGPPGSG